MSDKAIACVKCGKNMEPGFIADHGDGMTVWCCSWVEGTPERSFFTGHKTRGKRLYAVGTMRCTGCGFLESYANVQVSPKK